MLLVIVTVLLALVARANAASADDADSFDDRDAGDVRDAGDGGDRDDDDHDRRDGDRDARHAGRRADDVALAEARQLADALSGIERDDHRAAWQLAFGDLELDDAERATSILDMRAPEASSGALGDALAAGALERREANARRGPMHAGHLELDVAWRQSWRAPLRSSAYCRSELWLFATWRR